MKAEQPELQHEIVKASGLTNLYDFFYMVRSFTFFLEDKVPLIWSPRGQFEIFRILFFDSTKAAEFVKLGDVIQGLDSNYRNMRVYVNRAVKELEQTAGGEDSLQLREELRLKEVDVNVLEEKEANTRQQIDKALTRKVGLLEKLEKLRLTLEEHQCEFEGLLSTFFSRAFPDLPSVVGNVLNHLVSGHGCLVCGTVAVKKQAEYREKAERGVCPFCDTHISSTARSGPLSDASRAELKKLEDMIQGSRKSIAIVQQEMKVTEEELGKLYEMRAKIAADFATARLTAEQLRNRLPPSAEEIDKRRKEIDARQREMKRMRGDINEKTAIYAQHLETSRKILTELSEKLTNRFAYYAGHFLAEKCNLAYGEEKRSLGQEGEMLAFPNFHVVMTSGTSPKLGTKRSEETQVSESQKEFIDLAFRMALFDAVRQKDDGVMLVIETPEASLDTVFVDRAGDLLRKFADENTGHHNVVLASSNLSSANMVRSLLGIDQLTEEQVKTEVPKRIINLLELAAPNAAVREYRKVYDAELARSLKK